MPDFVIVNGQRVELPRECEYDMAARAAFIEKAGKAPKAAKTADKE